MSKKNINVAFLGGVGEIGKNMTVLSYGENLLIIDAGMSFPDEDMPGIDAVIPDFSYLRDNKDKIRGIILTHGHEDHIGAIPYLLEEFDIPVYGSDVTLALLNAKLKEHEVNARTFVVKDKDIVDLNPFKVEFFHVCHSVSGSFAVAVHTVKGVIFHTGDFKIDYTPVDDSPCDLQRFASLGSKGVLLMLGESTNVEREGQTVSEVAVGQTFDKIFADNKERRIIIATFASNINRLQQIITVAAKYERRVAFCGRSMLKASEIGLDLGILKVLPGDIVDIDRAAKMPDNRTCIVVTGSQGEPMSALSRMSVGDFSGITIGNNDTVIISASPIPGNERSVYSVINNLYKLGAKVCYHTLKDLHVSGHAHLEELKLMLSLIKPKFFMPVHGEYRHQVKHAELAIALGTEEDNVLIPEIGWQVQVGSKLKRIEDVKAGNSYIDGDTVNDNMELVIKDRKILSEDGIIIILVYLNKNGYSHDLPDVLYRGFTGSEEFAQKLKEDVYEAIKGKGYSQDLRGALKNRVGRLARNLARKSFNNNPMVVPIIVEK